MNLLIWIKHNRPLATVIGSVLILLLVGIPSWLYVSQKQNQVASDAYYEAVKALKKDDPESIKTAIAGLELVASKHPKSHVARLAKLQAAHLSLKLKDAQKAVSLYESLRTELSSSDKLRPLVLAGLRSAYQALGNAEKIQSLTTELQQLGFSQK